MGVEHRAEDIVRLFDATFAATENTRLVAGGDEPLYLPASGDCPWHRIIFRHDYFASALHEIAHWCVAGPQRRLLVDYGYWYDPDGRSAARQAEFEQVEARPQAVEWLLADAAGFPFRVSMDNLDSAEPLDEASLWRAVRRERGRCLAGAVPPRAARLAAVLRSHYGTG